MKTWIAAISLVSLLGPVSAIAVTGDAAAGAQKGTSPKDVASKTDIIITMVPDGPEVEQAVLGPNGVLEGATDIAGECVIGPYSRIVEASIGRGVELSGWNHVQRTTVRNQAVLEPFARRGLD